MNKIIKFAIGAAIVAPALIASSAFAATTFNNVSFDGMPNVTVQQGSTLNANMNVDLTSGSTIQSLKWEMVGSGLAAVCVNVADINTNGTFVINFPVDTTGATQGTWDFRVTTYGDVPPAANNNCNGTEGTNVTHDYNDQITLTQDLSTGGVINNTGHGSGTGSGSMSAMDKLIALLTAMITKPATQPVPVVSNACSEFAQFTSNAMPNARSQSNVALQGFLLSKGMSIPALAAGASFGYDGPQTQAAVQMYKMQNSCN